MDATPAPLSPEALLAHADWIRALAARLVADPSVADDVVQETWLSALQNPPRDASNVRGWLATVARNAAAGLGRSERARRSREQSVARREATSSTDELIVQASVQRELVGHVLELDEPYKSVVLLRWFEGLPPRAIAERTSTPVETVNTRLARAHALLRTKLDREHGDRTTWAALLVPLARPRALHSAATGTAVGVLWKVAAVSIVAVGAWLVLRPGDDAQVSFYSDSLGRGWRVIDGVATPIENPGADQSARVAARTPVPLAPVVSSPASTPAFPTTHLRGRVVDSDFRGKPGVAFTARDAQFPCLSEGRLDWHREQDTNGIPSSVRTIEAVSDDALLALRTDPALLASFVAAHHAVAGLREVLLGFAPAGEAISGVDGRFELDFAGEDASFVSREPGLEILLAGVLRSSGDTILVALPFVSLAGVVVDEAGQPIGGATLEAGGTIDHLPNRPVELAGVGNTFIARGVSEEDGRFEIAHCPVAPDWSIAVSARDHSSVSLHTPETSRDDLRVVLHTVAREPRWNITGLVLDASDHPVEGAWVHLGQYDATTDARGRFALEAQWFDDDVPLTATLGGFQAAVVPEFGRIARAARDRSSDVVLHLGGPALELAGHVVDEHGEPLAGWTIDIVDGTCSGTDSEATVESVTASGVGPNAVLDDTSFGTESETTVQSVTVSGIDHRAGVRTSASGAFLLKGLRDRDYQVRARDGDGSRFVVEPPARAGRHDLVIRVGPERFFALVRGRVVSASGAPFAAARVEVSYPLNRLSGGAFSVGNCQHVDTDELGRFEFANVPREGAYLTVSDPAQATYNRFDLDAPVNALAIELRVTRICRVFFEHATPEVIDAISLRDAAGKDVVVNALMPRATSMTVMLRVADRELPPCNVPESAVALVVWKGDEIVRQIPMQLVPGEANRVRF